MINMVRVVAFLIVVAMGVSDVMANVASIRAEHLLSLNSQSPDAIPSDSIADVPIGCRHPNEGGEKKVRSGVACFDLSDYAGVSVIGDGTLTFYIKKFSDGQSVDPYGFQIRNLNVPFTYNEVSWNYRSSGQPWTDGVGNPYYNRGGVWDSEQIGTFASPAAVEYELQTVTVPRNILQDWIDGNHHGIVFAPVNLVNPQNYSQIHIAGVTNTPFDPPTLEFEYLPPLPELVFTPDSGYLAEGETVTITCEVPGVEIHYTLDGSEPTLGSPLYTAPIAASGHILSARAWVTGYLPSPIKRGVYSGVRANVEANHMTGMASASPDHSYFDQAEIGVGYRHAGNGQMLSAVTSFDLDTYAGATIAGDGTLQFYVKKYSSTDNPDPDGFQILNLDKDFVYNKATWNERSLGNPWTNGDPDGNGRPYYNKGGVWDVSGQIGTFDSPAEVEYELQTVTVPRNILQDWIDGNHHGIVFAPVNLDVYRSASRIYIAGVTNAFYDAPVLKFCYLPAPTEISFTPEGGYLAEDETVTIRCVTPDAVIRCTLDGTDPTPESPLYTAPVAASGCVLSARAWVPGQEPGRVKRATYLAYNRPSYIYRADNNVTVDGNLSEWRQDEFVPLDQLFYGSPKITDAAYAVRWDGTNHQFYIAVKVYDQAHIFKNAYGGWDQQDGIEVYVHTTGGEPFDYEDTQTSAQQYVLGLKADRTGNPHEDIWATFAGQREVSWEQVGFQAAGVREVDGMGQPTGWLFYEVKVTAYEYLGLTPEASIISPLSVGDVVGIDVTVCDKWGTGVNDFGMKGENNVVNKYSDWHRIGLHKLARITADANGDGKVNVGDLGILAANYGMLSGATWEKGDFNGDGMVNVGDLGILAAHYGEGVSGLVNFTADYAKVFGTAVEAAAEEEADSLVCSSLGLPLIAGLFLMGLCLMNRTEG
jgi:hypothetical protein